MSKDANYKRMIQSVKWVKLRREKIKLNPLCQDCLLSGIYTPAQEVHHVVPCESAKTIKQMEELMFNIGNLRSLCHDCHVITHNELDLHADIARKTAELEEYKVQVLRLEAQKDYLQQRNDDLIITNRMLQDELNKYQEPRKKHIS